MQNWKAKPVTENTNLPKAMRGPCCAVRFGGLHNALKILAGFHLHLRIEPSIVGIVCFDTKRAWLLTTSQTLITKCCKSEHVWTPIFKANPNMDIESKIGAYTLHKEVKNFLHYCSSYKELMNAINHQPIIFSFLKNNSSWFKYG